MGEKRKRPARCSTFFLFSHTVLAVCCLAVTAFFSLRCIGIDIVYLCYGCHASVQEAGLEDGRRGPETTLATARRRRLASLWSGHVQALRKRIPESDTASLLFRRSRVSKGLENNVWRYAARQDIKDMREHLCDLLGTYLLRVVEKLMEEVMDGGERFCLHADILVPLYHFCYLIFYNAQKVCCPAGYIGARVCPL